jgi:hypothetical protein
VRGDRGGEENFFIARGLEAGAERVADEVEKTVERLARAAGEGEGMRGVGE